MNPRTDLNKIHGMRSPCFTDYIFGDCIHGKDFSQHPYVFHLLKYLYLCAVTTYIDHKSPDYLICFFLRNSAKEIENIIEFHEDRERVLKKLKVKAERTPEKLPKVLVDYLTGRNEMGFQGFVTHTISLEEIKQLLELLFKVECEFSYGKL